MNRTYHENNDFDSDPRSQRGPRGRRGGPRGGAPFGGPRFDADAAGRSFGPRSAPDFPAPPEPQRPFRGPRDEAFDPDLEGPRGPRGPGGPRGRGGRRGHGPRGGRAGRGDVRVTILRLLSEEPMHGYQLMQTISERSQGRWTPSAGAVYPTLAALADEGLITLVETDGRKLATLTDAGTAHVEQHKPSWADPFADAASDGPDLPALMHELHAAVRHATQAATETQRQRIGAILTRARGDVYQALAVAEEDDTSGQE